MDHPPLHTGVGSQGEALALFDSLEPCDREFMHGQWRGRELHCGHPLEGLLKTCGWYGKRFASDEEVYPMLFGKGNGNLFMANPARMPLSATLATLPSPLVKALFTVARPFIATRSSGARLRELTYRGKTGAAMIYDRIAVIDIFRKLDDNNLLAIMDLKGDTSNKLFFFTLTRD
jgi:hypothetical protein